jgi:hypothetical protein
MVRIGTFLQPMRSSDDLYGTWEGEMTSNAVFHVLEAMTMTKRSIAEGATN